MKSKQEGIF